MWNAFALSFAYKGTGKHHTLTKSKVHGVPTCVPDNCLIWGQSTDDWVCMSKIPTYVYIRKHV